ncbi:hypothetical protein TESG_06783 [Trichophyton tonsurans CBS 112818]|uniref:Uncharacterized protein n=1 Tax=Trichophyton tonsurans (strain CBS 112818) TaxID=647933 RepID=F2S7G7_TRIT1|nr:hypothetical protein TESG_06783 [Trichophyton tonsurans CBS 112818]
MIDSPEYQFVLLTLALVALVLLIFVFCVWIYYGLISIMTPRGKTRDRRERGSMIPLSNFTLSGSTPVKRLSDVGGERPKVTPTETKGAGSEPRRSSVNGTLSLDHPLPAPPPCAVRIPGLVRPSTPAIPMRLPERGGRVSPVDFTTTNRMTRWG